MSTSSLDDLIRILQLAISPVVLISGVGLLILSMTNRMSQLINRMRVIHQEILKTDEYDQEWEDQLKILFRRARLLKLGLLMFVLCILLDALMVIALFLIKLTGVNAGFIIALLFSFSLLGMVAGLVLFAGDVVANLRALKLELARR